MDKFLSVLEVAKLLGVHPETVRRWIREGRLEAFYAGRRQIISEGLEIAMIAGLREVPVEVEVNISQTYAGGESGHGAQD